MCQPAYACHRHYFSVCVCVCNSSPLILLVCAHTGATPAHACQDSYCVCVCTHTCVCAKPAHAYHGQLSEVGSFLPPCEESCFMFSGS